MDSIDLARYKAGVNGSELSGSVNVRNLLISGGTVLSTRNITFHTVVLLLLLILLLLVFLLLTLQP